MYRWIALARGAVLFGFENITYPNLTIMKSCRNFTLDHQSKDNTLDDGSHRDIMVKGHFLWLFQEGTSARVLDPDGTEQRELEDLVEAMIYEYENGQWYSSDPSIFEDCESRHAWISDSSMAMMKVLKALPLISGSSMAGSFIWLNARMDLQDFSGLIDWVRAIIFMLLWC